MGEVHTAKDRKIGRREMIEKERLVNSHAAMWNKMLGHGENNEHGGRIHDSIVQSDQSMAIMTLLLKDHKDGDKTRSVVTGNTSNSVGMSIIVSMFLEAVAASIDDPYEVNSSEDLIATIEEVNEIWRQRMKKDDQSEADREDDQNTQDNTINPCDRLLESLKDDRDEMSELNVRINPVIEAATTPTVSEMSLTNKSIDAVSEQRTGLGIEAERVSDMMSEYEVQTCLNIEAIAMSEITERESPLTNKSIETVSEQKTSPGIEAK